MDVAKPYEFIGFGAMDVTKPYEFIGSGPEAAQNQSFPRGRGRPDPPPETPIGHFGIPLMFGTSRQVGC